MCGSLYQFLIIAHLRGGSNEYPLSSMFKAEIRNIMHIPENPRFTIILKWSLRGARKRGGGGAGGGVGETFIHCIGL